MSNIKSKPKAGKLLQIIFEDCEKGFDASPSDEVEIQLLKTIDSLTQSERREILSGLRAICRTLNIDSRMRRKSDLVSMMLGASYWAFLLRAFPMEMSSDYEARERRWTQVEHMSGRQKDDVFKLAEYFGTLIRRETET